MDWSWPVLGTSVAAFLAGCTMTYFVLHRTAITPSASSEPADDEGDESSDDEDDVVPNGKHYKMAILFLVCLLMQTGFGRTNGLEHGQGKDGSASGSCRSQ